MRTVPDKHTSNSSVVLLLPTQIFWLPSFYFILHTIEELPNFATWVSRHFGAMSNNSFAFVHIPLILLVMLTSYKATSSERSRGWVVFATAVQVQFAINALVHIVTTVLFLEYSPGLVTATCLALPMTAGYIAYIRQEQGLTNRELAIAFIFGMVMALLAIGVLFLH